MELMQINGGIPLTGKVKAAGAKNAMTKLLVASLLSNKRCLFHNVPNIGDVEITVDLCREIGSEIQWDRKEGILEIVTKEIRTSFIPQRFSGSNRIPILMIGALLGRSGEDIIVPTVGGCNIGKRPVNFHLDAFKQMGATVEYREMKKEGAYFAHAHKGLTGTLITLPYPSVGATENAILAATRARGSTTIKNAALEPEVIDLILFLQKLGAHITLDTDRTIRVEQATQFYDVEHTVMTDRVEAASYGMAAVGTKGRIFVEGARQQDMIIFLKHLRKLGGQFTVRKEGIEFFADPAFNGGVHIETDVYPGFLTDWQQPFVVLLTQAPGISVIHETVYENRFGYTEMLKKMGADIELFTACLGNKTCRFADHAYHHSLIVKGPTPLHGEEIAIPDLRAGFAYVLAALIAEGETTLSNLHFLTRGYEELTTKLTSLGASVSLLTPADV